MAKLNTAEQNSTLDTLTMVRRIPPEPNFHFESLRQKYHLSVQEQFLFLPMKQKVDKKEELQAIFHPYRSFYDALAQKLIRYNAHLSLYKLTVDYTNEWSELLISASWDKSDVQGEECH